MKRRAGAVGERFGREHLGPFWDALPCGRPRLHLVGHSFGAKLLTSAVLGGVHPRSLTLLQAAFSAFAFAPEVPNLMALWSERNMRTRKARDRSYTFRARNGAI